ncbi:DUF4912 domain-containing protein [Candidatus Sumerlaeota bacterium]|nr:DUF4912 domain-containing protein [Candidatus Sumerlaeota bacterium]
MAKAKKNTESKTAKVTTKKAPAAASAAKPAKVAVSKKSTASTASPRVAKKPASTAASATVKVPAASKTKSAPHSPSRNGTAKKAAVAKSPITANQFLAVERDHRELPLDYGDTKIVLMSRDPEWIFAFWEINAETRRKMGLVRGKHDKALTVRIYELNNGVPGTFSDVTVNDFTSSWYFKVPNANSSYRAVVGVIEKGDFKTIATSNTIAIPRHGIAEETSVEFAEINDEVYSQIVQLSGGHHISERLGGEDFIKTLQQKVFQSLTAGPLFSGTHSGNFPGSSSLFSGAGFSGDLFSAPGIGGEAGLKSSAKPGEFWLEVGVDVIVYGATSPDAKVKLMGKELRLTPDGTFRVRMVLPDSTVEFPVEAVSADGQHRRRVKPTVTRETSGSPHKPV